VVWSPIPSFKLAALRIQQPATITLFSVMRDYYEENWKTYQLKLTVVDFSRQISRIRDTDVWLGYVLEKDDLLP